MKPEDIKDQVVKYVQVLETNYMECIRDLKEIAAKHKL